MSAATKLAALCGSLTVLMLVQTGIRFRDGEPVSLVLSLSVLAGALVALVSWRIGRTWMGEHAVPHEHEEHDGFVWWRAVELDAIWPDRCREIRITVAGDSRRAVAAIEEVRAQLAAMNRRPA